jgi:hypothetical protein
MAVPSTVSPTPTLLVYTPTHGLSGLTPRLPQRVFPATLSNDIWLGDNCGESVVCARAVVLTSETRASAPQLDRDEASASRPRQSNQL